MEPQIYETKVKKLKGDYRMLRQQALALYKLIASKTKRKPYIRSKYFKKEKIFLDYFWQHLHEKTRNDQERRLKFYSCALDLIKNSKAEAVVKNNPNKKSEIFYKFNGVTKSNDLFYVQIKEDKKGGKHFMSVFP